MLKRSDKKGTKISERCVQRVVTNASELCEIGIKVIMRKDDDMYQGDGLC